jgi:pyruvate,water dikinase
MGENAMVRVVSLQDVGRADVGRVGGKNCSLGEMIRAMRVDGLHVPPGFATTSEAYWEFVDLNGLRPVIAEALAELQRGQPR